MPPVYLSNEAVSEAELLAAVTVLGRIVAVRMRLCRLRLP